MSTLRLVWEVILYRPGRWFFCFVMWTFVHGLPLLFGILIGLVFERLSEGSPVDETAWAPAIVFAVLAIGRNLITPASTQPAPLADGGTRLTRHPAGPWPGREHISR